MLIVSKCLTKNYFFSNFVNKIEFLINYSPQVECHLNQRKWNIRYVVLHLGLIVWLKWIRKCYFFQNFWQWRGVLPKTINIKQYLNTSNFTANNRHFVIKSSQATQLYITKVFYREFNFIDYIKIFQMVLFFTFCQYNWILD
jgi:hypothetical protein